MKQKIFSVTLAVALVMSGGAYSASAHNGVDHGAGEVHATAHKELSLTQMETLIGLLKQVIALMEARNSVIATVPAPATSAITHDDDHDIDLSGDMIDHHDEDTTTDKLIIEVEEHMSKTHVHIRYTDKPEDMFFVDVTISNEAGIIKEITDRSGMTAEIVKAALKYQ